MTQSASSPGDIKRVCVIGAGVMGAGIAAQIANSGTPVLLLDIVRDQQDRNAVAKGAIGKMLKTDPAPFMSRSAAKLVTPGNIEDDLEKVAECDWIVEAVVERLDVKQGLYAKLEKLARPGAAISSNTSTMPLAQLTEGRADSFRRSFLITHFFNPPRYMRLLEIVSGKETDGDIADRVAAFADRALGKTVVSANDTPGFIANRIGTFWIQLALNAAIELGITVEEADAVIGRPMGIPKTGIFGLMDLVGIDLMPHLQASLTKTLPKDDPYQAIAISHPVVEKMIAEGFTGRKGRGGFYRVNREAGKVKESIDLGSGHYAASKRFRLPSGPSSDLGALLSMEGKLGEFAWKVLSGTLHYAASLVPEIADDIVSVDEAMKLGYNWRFGPFELIDKIGATAFADRLKAEGRTVPRMVSLAADRPFHRVKDGQRQFLGTDGDYHDVARPEGVLLLSDIKLSSKPLSKNASAALWDIGDGVVVLEFTSKSNSLDGETMKMVGEAVALVKAKHKALVIYNEGSNFSAGANLGLALFALNIAAWGEIEKLVSGGQKALKALKYAPFPVVGAPSGMALGGGCEFLLHCDAIQAHAESYIGLVECGVGLIPGWGGCGEMLDRWQKNPRLPKGPMPPVAKVFETVSMASVAKSAAEARELGFMRSHDKVTMNRDRLLFDAKQTALALAEKYTAPEPPEFHLPGATGRAGLKLAIDGFHKRGIATDYDVVVAGSLATVLTGGETDATEVTGEADLLKLERQEFLKRVKDNRSIARVEHMLETGKPLRN